MPTWIKVGEELPSVEKVSARPDYALRVKFKAAQWVSVRLDGMIARHRALAPLRDATVFRKAHVIDWGAAVGWPGDLGIGAETLLRMAEEQKPFGTSNFVRWQRDARLSNAEAADALGLSLATIKNYRAGAEIPAAIAIACRAMANEPATLAAHFRPRNKAGRPKAA